MEIFSINYQMICNGYTMVQEQTEQYQLHSAIESNRNAITNTNTLYIFIVNTFYCLYLNFK